MSRFMVMLLASVTAGGALMGAASSAQAQAYMGGYAEVYAGDVVQVYVGGGWSQATVLEVNGNSALVRYFDAAWGDAWIDISQLSVSGGVQGGGYQPAIQVYWGSQWYDGTLLATRNGRYHVRYRGVSEWVGAERWHHRGGRSSQRGYSVGRQDHGRGRGYGVGERHGRNDRGGVRGDHRGNDRGGVRGGHRRNERGNDRGGMRGNQRGNDRGDRHGEAREGSRGRRDSGNRNGGRRGNDGRRGGGRGHN